MVFQRPEILAGPLAEFLTREYGQAHLSSSGK
jgi:hypothetical protein